MDGKNIKNSDYRCCFCALLIKPSFSDPCEIDILSNIDKSKLQQYNQIFYSHMNCLKKQLHIDIQQNYFYIESLVKSKNNLD